MNIFSTKDPGRNNFQPVDQVDQGVFTQVSISPPPAIASVDVGGLLKQFNTPQGWMMVAGLLFLVMLSQVLGKGRGKISTGRTVGVGEKLAATNLALKQIKAIQHLQTCDRTQSSKAKPLKHNEVTLWCGTPQYWAKGKGRGLIANLQTLLGSSPTVWLPDAQRSFLVLGAPGSGKTYGVIDRAIESAFQQGIPVLLYDKKGEQLRLHAPLAARYGYDVHVFAPGEPYSGILNPLDFIRDERDSVMAGELGAVINRNASTGGKTDEFFSKAGDLLVKALLQLVKSEAAVYHDMAMLYAVLRLPHLVKRIDYAIQNRRIDEWVATSFNQFLAAKEAEKTISGILTTAAGTFSSFIQADLLRAFIGKSTIPKRIQSKQIIIFKLDDERRSVIGPLLAAAIHLCIVSNLSTPRQDPIAIFLDELPSLKLDRLPQWINEYRSNGGVFMLGAQSLNQLYEIYGEKMGGAIASACSTHILFNPGDSKTAEEYSKRYGEQEVNLKNKSTSRSSGQHSNYSTSYSESLQRVPLFTVDQILRFPAGKCVITNPGYKSSGEGSVPYPLKIPVPMSDQKRAKESEALWDSHLRPALADRIPPIDPEKLTQDLYKRIEQAHRMLPLPEEEDTPQHRKQGAEEEMALQPQSKQTQARSMVDALDFMH
jgi:type IV secretion system protein VirD4